MKFYAVKENIVAAFSFSYKRHLLSISEQTVGNKIRQSRQYLNVLQKILKSDKNNQLWTIFLSLNHSFLEDISRYCSEVIENAIKRQTITKTCLYNFDPLKRHFYIVKLGFTGVYIFFSYFARKHRLWVVRTASLFYL